MDILTSFFKLLSDQTRLRIILLLYSRKLCVCQLCGIIGESQPKVSKHLAKMRDMGVVKYERQDQFIFYSLNINEEVLNNILRLISENSEHFGLKTDMEKLNGADSYLEICSCKDKVL